MWLVAFWQISTNKQKVIFNNRHTIIGNFSIGGPLESKGPLKDYLSYKLEDDTLNESSFEKAERKLLEHIIFGAIDNAKLTIDDVDALLGGDLLNQIISSSFSARKFGITFIGLYSACATMAESLALGACLVDRKVFNNI